MYYRFLNEGMPNAICGFDFPNDADEKSLRDYEETQPLGKAVISDEGSPRSGGPEVTDPPKLNLKRLKNRGEFSWLPKYS